MYKNYSEELSVTAEWSGMSDNAYSVERQVAVAESWTASNNYCDRTERNKDMSCCISLMDENEIYIIADSRSTIIEKHGDNVVNKTFSDDYQKIVIVPGTRIAVFSTGANVFCKTKTFSDIIAELESRDENDIYREIHEKYDCNDSCFYIAGFFSDKEMGIIHNDGTKLSVIKNTRQCFCNTIGTPYAAEIIKSLFDYCKNSTENLSKKDFLLNSLQTLCAISPTIDNTIGGPIQMVRITPEKAEWVEGFKPDFIK